MPQQPQRGLPGRPVQPKGTDNISRTLQAHEENFREMRQQISHMNNQFGELVNLLKPIIQGQSGPQLSPGPQVSTPEPEMTPQQYQAYEQQVQQKHARAAQSEQEIQAKFDAELAREPKVRFLIQEVDAFRFKGHYWPIGPAGTHMTLPRSAYQEYMSRCEGRAQLNRFESRLANAAQFGALQFHEQFLEQEVEKVLGGTTMGGGTRNAFIQRT